MKKTLSVNLGGRVFSIDEDAYQELTTYLNDVKRHLGDEASSGEVLNDIEQRVSELFTQWMQGIREVITTDDVAKVIAILGRPEQYENEENSSEEKDKSGTSSQAGTQGEGSTHSRRRLYRDTENSFLGGVCSGVAVYLNTSVILLRLLFVLLFLFWGSGILFYLVCWIIIPEARTAAQRLEMEGEDVTIDNIEKKVREEYERVRGKVGGYVSSPRFERNARGAGNGLMRFLSILFKVFFAFIAAIVGLAGLMALIGLIIALTALWTGNIQPATEWPHGLWPLQQALMYPPSATFMTIGIILTLGIPVIAIFKVLFTRTLDLKPSPKWLIWVGLLFWVIGLTLCIYSGVHVFALSGGCWG
jgi:phage shock protein PspC (stress-responsive transcriptional regulator)